MRAGCHRKQYVTFAEMHAGECGIADEVYGTLLDFRFEWAQWLDGLDQIVIQLKHRWAGMGESAGFIWHS